MMIPAIYKGLYGILNSSYLRRKPIESSSLYLIDSLIDGLLDLPPSTTSLASLPSPSLISRRPLARMSAQTASFSCYEVDLILGPTPEEATAIVGLLAAYAAHPLGGGQSLPERARRCLVEELRRRAAMSHVFLALEGDGTAVGLCICFEGFSTFACAGLLNVHDVFVEERCRGRGVAPLLLETAERTARSLGMCKLTLEVLANNEPAKRAYRRSGFQNYRLSEEHGEAEFWHKPLV